MTNRTIASGAIALALSGATVAAADSVVTLTSIDGSTVVQGELISFEEDFYVIDTSLGPLRVSTRQMSCEGASCPTTETGEVSLTLLGADELGRTLVPLLISGFARTRDAQAETVVQSDGSVFDVSLIGDDGFGETLDTYRVMSRTSNDAFDALLDQDAQIGMSARRITRDEARGLSKAGAGNMVAPEREVVVALDSMSVIVNQANPVSSLTIDDIRGIYAGEISNWSQLGGPDLPITIVARQQGTSARDFFDAQILGEGRVASATIDAASDTEIANVIADDEAAIGYVGLAFTRQNKAVELVDSCGLQFRPTTFGAKTEEYPLVRRLYLYNRGDDLPDQGREFIDFAQSQTADTFIAKAGFVDLGMERASQATVAEWTQQQLTSTTDEFRAEIMEDYASEASQWDRLSITFRFRTASTELSAKAERDLERLIQYLGDQGASTELAVVGFTDNDGPDSSNLRLGQLRAEQVASRLQDDLASLNIDIASQSFGELGAVACNDTAEGKARNRRVEIWIRG